VQRREEEQAAGCERARRNKLPGASAVVAESRGRPPIVEEKIARPRTGMRNVHGVDAMRRNEAGDMLNQPLELQTRFETDLSVDENSKRRRS
jgi:hypothetical protein